MAEPLQTERDTTPVTITLDRRRPYHIGDNERNVIWVGPGAVEVPRWVAEHWGAIPAAPAPLRGGGDAAVPNSPTLPAPAVPRREPAPRDELDGLGLSDEQLATLRAAGYSDLATVARTTDSALLALPTIGKAAVRLLREASQHGDA